MAYSEDVIGCDEHVSLALRAAQEGIVLMQNENNVLPLDRNSINKIALFGKFGDKENIGDYGSSRVYPKYVVTPMQGICNVAPNIEVIYYDGSDIEHAKRLAKEADAVVFIVGYNYIDEGEYVATRESENYTESKGGDRIHSLGLHDDDIELIKAVGPVNPNSTAVLIGGNMIMITEWKDYVSSILMAFYPGQEGGTAIAQILFGDINPSGKLPFVLPVNESDLPAVKWDTTNEYYDYYHGYARLERNGVKPLLPYGFGLSYTTFDISRPEFSTDMQTITAKCRVKNTGKSPGTEVIQMYVGFKNSKIDRPVKLLRGFSRCTLQAGEEKEVIITCPVEKLCYFNEYLSKFELEHMEYDVYISTSSADKDLLKGYITL